MLAICYRITAIILPGIFLACAHGMDHASTWPPSSWDRVEIVRFNHIPDGPHVSRLAFGPRGWSAHIVERRPIDRALGIRAVELVDQVQGNAIMTGCPFPRLAIVFFDRDRPIASANYDVGGGDLMIWPHYPLTPEEEAARYEFVPAPDDPETILQAWTYRYSAWEWQKLFEETGISLERWRCGHQGPF